MRQNVYLIPILFSVMSLIPPRVGAPTVASPPPADAETPAQAIVADAPAVQADVDLGRMPVYFIENQGQLDKRVAYYIQGGDKTIYFTPEGVTFALTKQTSDAAHGNWSDAAGDTAVRDGGGRHFFMRHSSPISHPALPPPAGPSS